MQNDPITHVFFVTSQGYAGDHWFSWFAKALNAHPELFAYLGNEGSRPKYFPEERSRSERPDIVSFTRFIADVGMTYKATGDCYSYRTSMLHPLFKKFGDWVPCVNLSRHPYCWLKFYIDWRAMNMRMLEGENNPLDHEWQITKHQLFEKLELKSYTKDEVETWAAFQGMFMLNGVTTDFSTDIPNFQIEKIVTDPALFQEVISFLSHDRVHYPDQLLKLVYSWVYKPFRGERLVRILPEEEYHSWPSWKKEAFEAIIDPKIITLFESIGYEF